ncbi:MAG: type VII secretion target [Pseudonocardiaceae bacterium]
MAEEYQVLTEALTDHAGKVDGIADRLAQAADAAGQMSLASDAYGALCMDLALHLDPLQAVGALALYACGKQLSTTADGIRITARDYAALEDANALALQRAMEVR